ncbi:hypothetical protein LTR85_009015 [Meristemomyces frigidus]|nr:hypothetical protein LTR85_009015 [Meristemomyces frigidus]
MQRHFADTMATGSHLRPLTINPQQLTITKHTLMTLGADVRKRIYEYVLPEGDIISATSKFPPIVQVCKTIRAEALAVWRHHNLFTIGYTMSKDNGEGGRRPAPCFVNGALVLKLSALSHIDNLGITSDPPLCACGRHCGYRVIVVIMNRTYRIKLKLEKHCNMTPRFYTVKLDIGKAKAWVAAFDHYAGGHSKAKFTEAAAPEIEEGGRIRLATEDEMGMNKVPTSLAEMPDSWQLQASLDYAENKERLEGKGVEKGGKVTKKVKVPAKKQKK